MAKLNYGILTRGRNKVGPVVYYQRGNEQIVREYVKHINDARTPGQLLTRARFSALRSVARFFRVPASIGYKNLLHGAQTPTSMFMKKNWTTVSGGTPAETEVDFTQLVVSDGTCPSVGFNSASMEQALQVDVTFRADSDQPGASANDNVYVFVYQADLNEGVLGAPVLRSAARAAVTVPSGWSGMRVHVYGFVKAIADNVDSQTGIVLTNAGDCSRTTYLGSGTIV